MFGILDYLLLPVLLVALVHFLLPRDPLLRQSRGRLSLRPSLRHLLGESTAVLALLLGAAYVLAWLAAARVLPAAVLAGLVMVWLAWRLWRRWQTAAVVFDRATDSIRHGPIEIGRASRAAVVQVTGDPASALGLFLHDAAGKTTWWAVPDIDGSHAAAVGRVIADFLGVPLVTRLV